MGSYYCLEFGDGGRMVTNKLATAYGEFKQGARLRAIAPDFVAAYLWIQGR